MIMNIKNYGFLRLFFSALKFRLRVIFRSIFLIVLLYIIVFSDFGLKDYWQLRKQQNVLEAQLIKVESEKASILKRVRAISGPIIDLDLLELQVRKVLGYARNQEKIFFWK